MNLLFAFLFSVLFAPVNDYTVLADQAKVGFTIKNAGFKVNGSMKGLKGDIKFSPDDLGLCAISLSVSTASVDTDNKTRDKHLRGEDYFEVEKYPTITFTSTSVKKSGNGYLVKGTFKVKNTTKEVEIPFTFQQNVFKGSFSINRIEYGVGKKSWIMDKTVNITFQIPVEG